MPVNDELGKRIKLYYEQIPQTKLLRRTPVAIRIDGKAFHTFTKGFRKPFDDVLIKSMQETAKYLCENIQGCVLGYTQSDEITLILIDYQNLNTSAWFDYKVQKICSIAASMATMVFNRVFAKMVDDISISIQWADTYSSDIDKDEIYENLPYIAAYEKAIEKGAMFDARCFNIPKEDVTNLIYWRQLDAIRNSIQMVGQANFSHSELQNKSCKDIQNILMLQKNIINWNDYPTYKKRGTCIVRRKKNMQNTSDKCRTEWVIDTDIPMFNGEYREYIEEKIIF